MITSYSRGHKIIFKNKKWVYVDTLKVLNSIRPCKKCGKPPTLEGHDDCLGEIKGVVSACCGHGVFDKIIVKEKIK